MALVEQLKTLFGSQIDNFNNSEAISIVEETKLIDNYPLSFEFIYIPDLGSDVDIANALTQILTVPFTIIIKRNNDKIESISIYRVFQSNQLSR